MTWHDMIPCGNNKEFQRSWEVLKSSHNVSVQKHVRDSRRTGCPDVFHTSRWRAHMWKRVTWILDTVRLKFKLKFKCVQSTVRTSKRRKVTMIYFEYKYWVHMYVRESTARSLFYIQRHVPRIDGTEFKFTCVQWKNCTFVLEKAQEKFEVCLCGLVQQRQLHIEVKILLNMYKCWIHSKLISNLKI